jgi:uncharacterized NAD(P)/FAD-binding protein YdhS
MVVTYALPRADAYSKPARYSPLRDADGRAAGDIFTLGPLLRGSRYETTAVPEIRGQAAVLARHLLARPWDPRSGSAA